MRFAFLTILGCFISIFPAQATPITKDAANAYYQNCLAQPADGLTQKSKEMLCACTAAKMMERMNVEDIQAMAQQNEDGRKAMNYMIVKVYAPCMSFPAKDHYYNNCITNPQTKALSRNPQGLCNCMATKVANYLGENGSQVFEDILRRNPTMTDPMTALTEDQNFKNYAQTQLMSCVVQ
ncbi:MAG TPA: hypothetical protein PLF01_07515 [Alphaproteobacteria bacterium]|nr:hypothetical protein [Alphaproteobacteria bacterium]